MLPPGIVKFQDAEHEAGSGIVEWTAPDMNWNPWINQSMIIEGAEEYQVSVPHKSNQHFRMFMPIVSAPLYCAHNSCSKVMPHRALSAC